MTPGTRTSQGRPRDRPSFYAWAPPAPHVGFGFRLSTIQFQSLARDVEIGANSYLLSFGDTRVLVDAGMHPKKEGGEALPDFGGIDFGSLDAAVLSHAHLDHSGAMPIIQRSQPEMPVFTSEATAALADALLHNSVNVMTSKREELGRTDYPLFSHREVGRAARAWAARKPGRPFPIGPGDDLECTFYEAGHVLGATGAKFERGARTVFYTGDVHFEDQTIVRGADFPEGGVDVLIVECTRGDSPRPPGYSRWAEGERLAAAIEGCLSAGGSVMIPLFAMGKTQETLTLLYELQRARRLRPLPFHIGGLSVKMTGIYDRFADRVRRNHRGMRLLRTDGLLATPGRRGEMPELGGGKVFALSSGMMSERTMSNRVARRFIHNPKNLVAVVGYADPASPLARVLGSARGEEVELDARHDPVRRDCSVERFDFSGHAPREQLVDYVEKLKPEITILVHGDRPAVEWMAGEIAAQVPETEVVIPEPGVPVEIG